MTSIANKDDEPPDHSDLAGWRQAIAENRLQQFRPEVIVAAIQHIGPDGDHQLLNALLGHISDQILRILRRHISKRHRNQGLDIIERAHNQLILAILNPQCADGKGLCKAFVPRVEFRANDALVVEGREQARFQSYELDDNGETIEPPDNAPPDYAEQIAHVENLLSKIQDSRKRLAFRLYMEGCPISPGKGTTSVAEALGVSARTAGEWITQVQSFLKKTGVSNESA